MGISSTSDSRRELPGGSADSRASFPKEFLFGTATSSYQVEGGWNAGGKGESIWDRFVHTVGKVRGGDTGDIACDHVHRFRDDVDLLSRLNQQSYRFSISWPRVQPTGRGKPNSKGIDYYSRLVDAVLEAGIRPFCTLYHWDLPQALEELGGWPNRDLASYFADYARLVADRLGDRIKVWAPFNMPWTFTYFGYGIGIHPPGRADYALFLKAAHTVSLAQGESLRGIKDASPDAQVGSAYGMAPAYPESDSDADRQAVERYNAMNNDYFLSAALRGDYPRAFIDETPYEEMGFKPGDEKIMLAPLDWVGFHYYTRRLVAEPKRGAVERRRFGTEVEERAPERLQGDFDAYMPTVGPLTHGGLEVWPQGLYDLVMRITRTYESPVIEITECGCSYLDGPTGEEAAVHDGRRTSFFRAHLAQLARAIRDGAKVRAFHAWSLLDNFEWTEGFAQRYGLTYVDFSDQRRIVKDSGEWYARVAASRMLDDEPSNARSENH